MGASEKKKEIISGLIESARKFRFCGPSDDPDEITSVTVGFRHLVIQFQRLVGPMLSAPDQALLSSISVAIDDLYSAFDANSELEALLPEVEEAMERLDDGGVSASNGTLNRKTAQQGSSV